MTDREKVYALYLASKMQLFYDTSVLADATYDEDQGTVRVGTVGAQVRYSTAHTLEKLEEAGYSAREIEEALTFVGVGFHKGFKSLGKRRKET